MRYGKLFVLVATFAPSAFAESAGSTAAQVLRIGVGARAMAMGEAYVAQADDASSLYWNPAGLALMSQREMSFMYSQLQQDITFQHASLGLPVMNGAFGGSVSYLSYGDIPGFDETGASIGNQKSYSAVGTLGAAWLFNFGSVGLSVKSIQEKLADVKAQGVAFDVGTTLIYPRPVMGGTLRLGAVYQNAGPGIQYITEKDSLPSQWKVGVAAVQLLDKKLNLSLDYAKPTDDTPSINGGFEVWPVSFLALRAGYILSDVEGKGVRAGIGLRVNQVAFNYAFTEMGDLGYLHRYEVSLRFGEPRPILSAEERAMFKEGKTALKNGDYDRAVLLFNSLVEMEPRYKPVRKWLTTAMSQMEDRETKMAMQQGGSIDPVIFQSKKSAPKAMGDLDDIEQILSTGEARTAQAAPLLADPSEVQP